MFANNALEDAGATFGLVVRGGLVTIGGVIESVTRILFWVGIWFCGGTDDGVGRRSEGGAGAGRGVPSLGIVTPLCSVGVFLACGGLTGSCVELRIVDGVDICGKVVGKLGVAGIFLVVCVFWPSKTS